MKFLFSVFFISSLLSLQPVVAENTQSVSDLEAEVSCRIRTHEGSSDIIQNSELKKSEEHDEVYTAQYKHFQMSIVYLHGRPHRLFIEDLNSGVSAYTNLRVDGVNLIVHVNLSDVEYMHASCRLTPKEG